ncbi:hypothetical protein OV208_35385 [Corallococcus sp. bb12-1]|uniref:hypothetical protein n=1 Tax=Corallococcus sp. bb12-1 TaxID=2996784 RepID=UPI00227060C5|nr:hypothetical protein [Corallococcus sp. bb12-1]MCY1046641.1 hypothetical protein [Corallococcus sp. bb12-1]
MLRSVSSLAKVLALFVLCACAESDPCEDVDCGPGQCVPSSEQAACSCPQGYVPAGMSCKRDVREGDDHGDSIEAATPVEPMEPLQRVAANLDNIDDVDLFSFHVTAGRIYRFSCHGSRPGYNATCFVALLGADGLTLPGSAGSGGTSSFHAAVLATQEGTVYARVKPYSRFSYDPPYEYSLLDLGPDDFANTLTEATPVPVGTTVSGNIEPGIDVDVFALDAVAGRAYRLSCRGSSYNNCAMRVRGPGGEVLYQSQLFEVKWRSDTFDLQGAQEGRHTVEMFFTPGIIFSTNVGDYTFSVADLEP